MYIYIAVDATEYWIVVKPHSLWWTPLLIYEESEKKQDRKLTVVLFDKKRRLVHKLIFHQWTNPTAVMTTIYLNYDRRKAYAQFLFFFWAAAVMTMIFLVNRAGSNLKELWQRI